MVKRFIHFFNKEFSGLHQAAFLLSLASLVSQLLGLFRDRLLAHAFGASATLDLYYAAFRIPDLIFVLVASFLSVTVLIPILIERGHQNDIQNERRFMDSLFTFFLFAMVPTMALAYFFAPLLNHIFVPGFSEAQQGELLVAVRILLFSPLFLGLSNLFGSVTQAKRRFMVFAISPILYNLGIIVGILLFYPTFGLRGLVFGVVLGAFMHMIIQLPTIFSSGLFPRIISDFNFGDIKVVIVRSLPRTLGLGALQLAVTFLITKASYMASGSIAVFNFAYNLQSVPISLIGISYSVAAFPLMSKLNAEGRVKEFAECVGAGIRHIIFWIIPFVSLLIILRAQIVRIILGSGRFSWSDTRLTAACLALFAVGVIFQNIVLMLDRSYYARHQTRVPVITNLVGSITIVLLAILLPKVIFGLPRLFEMLASVLKVGDVAGKEVLILPLAYSVGSFANFILEWLYFRRDTEGAIGDRFIETLMQSFSASLVMALVAHLSLFELSKVFDLNTFMGVFAQGILSGFLGVVAGVFILRLLDNREVGELIDSLKKKFGLISITIPNQDQL